MGYAFAAPAQAVVPIDGTTDLYPVHRIYCVGRNYADHAKEMGFSGREAPFFFMKPADAVLPVPCDIAPEAAAAHLWGYAVGLDMTRRDLQFALRDKGRPWDVAKGFDCSAPISPLKPIAATGEITAGAIWLEVNGAKRQSSDIDKLIWNVNETVSHLSKYYTLAPGDLIYTGTPEGVGAVVRGDLLVGGVAGLGTLQVRIV